MELKLYEIAPEFRELVEKDELTEEDAQRLDELGAALEVKVDNIAAMTDKLETFAEYCKGEEQRIAAKRKAVENRIAWLNNYLQTCMEAAGVYRVEVGTRKLSLKKNPPKVVVDNEEDIPPRYFTVEQVTKLDKNQLKADLKIGPVSGAHLEQGLSLRKK